VVGYEEQFTNIFQHVHFPLDPRQVFRIWHASTLKVYGTYLGTDKIGHFTDMGRHYYNAYSKARREGKDESAAMAAAVKIGTEGALFSERGVVGYLSAGAYSNADLIANYVGLLFYRNLTDPIMLEGEMRPPMLERDGTFWKIAEHVENDADFFRWFISDHLNEALNPSHFESGMRNVIRKAIRERTEVALNRYVDSHGNRRSQRWFKETLVTHVSYFGADYGHHGSGDELVHIANTCFEPLPAHDDINSRNILGETPLHVAARLGDRADVRQLLDRGTSVNVTVQSSERHSPAWGDTPLHSTVIDGHRDVLEILIEARANVNARNIRGVTPLHRAVDQPEILEALLRHGADPSIADRLGRTPLHYAASGSPQSSVRALVTAGSPVATVDVMGRTALHEAALNGREETVQQLLAAGADANAVAQHGLTPLQLAAQNGHVNVVDLLLVRGCDIQLSDEFGWTALHHATDHAHLDVVRTLLENQADVDSPDGTGNSPLHLAARRGTVGVAILLMSYRADVQRRNSHGATPLHAAAFSGSQAILEVLMKQGADPAARNARGQTAGDVAALHDHKRLQSLLARNPSLTSFTDR